MKIFVAAVVFGCCLGSRADARVGRYELRVKPQKIVGSGYTDEQFDVSLVDRARRRVLWKRRVDIEPGASWSRDGRAVAVVILDSDWRFLVWREGFRLREFSVPGGFDYTMGLSWSPDNRRLLVRLGASGNVDTNTGALFCLKLERWPRYKYFKVSGDEVRPFGWKSRRIAWYQAVNFDVDFAKVQVLKLKRRRLWRAP
jgi:hypothetical protein